MLERAMDTFICVHTSDLGDVFELALRAYAQNFKPGGRLMLISNDASAVRTFIERIEYSAPVFISSDGDWLSRQELALPGWYRQQIIKLRSYSFCESEYFCNLGADTVLLQPIEVKDLLQDGRPILYYTTHAFRNHHYWYEWLRVTHVARLLGVQPVVARRYVDFINDLFCFDRDTLIALNQHLERRYGSTYYYTMLRALGRKTNRFGEWTLYSVYLLDCLHDQRAVRDAARGFSHQVRTTRALHRYTFDAKVIHFVDKNLDTSYIRKRIVERNPAPAHRVPTDPTHLGIAI